MLFRVCLEKSTGKLIESQEGDAKYGTLIKNAINNGYSESGIEEKNVEINDYLSILDSQISESDKIKAELLKLDEYLPRCVEDLILVANIELSKLPQIMQDRLKQKELFRERLKLLQNS